METEIVEGSGWQTVLSRDRRREERRTQAKRARADMDSSNDEEKFEEDWIGALADSDQITEDVRYVGDKLREICADPTKKINKSVGVEVMKLFGDVSRILTNLLVRNTYLRGVLSERDRQINFLSNKLEKNEKESYAAMAEKGRSGTIRPPLITGSKETAPPIKKFSAIVKVSNETEEDTSDKVKKKLLATLRPVQNGLHVDSIRKLRSKAVVVEVKTKEDLEKIMSNTEITSAGLYVGAMDKRRPKLQIFDVPAEFSKDYCLEAIVKQNKDILGEMKTDELEKRCTFCFRTGKRGLDTTNCEFEVDPELQNIFRRVEKIYIGRYRCRVVDFTTISRCFKCQGLGHISKGCREEKETCGRCTDEGHRTKDCKNEDPQRKCAICKRKGTEFDHASNVNCPYYKFLLDLNKNKTDYGQ